MPDEVMELIQDLRPVRQEPGDITPATEEIKRKYFNIFTEYSTKNLTHKQLAEEYHYSLGYIKKILKWCSDQVGSVDPATYKEAMVERVSVHLQKMDGLLDLMAASQDRKGQLAVMTEIRKVMKLLGQAQGFMESDSEGGGRVNVQINLPNIGRGTGVGGGEAQVVEVKRRGIVKEDEDFNITEGDIDAIIEE